MNAQSTANSRNNESDWFTPDTAAREAHVGRSMVYREVRAGRLKAARVGGRQELRIHRAWLMAWLESLAAS